MARWWICQKNDYLLDESAQHITSEFFEKSIAKKNANFSNGRFARNTKQILVINNFIDREVSCLLLNDRKDIGDCQYIFSQIAKIYIDNRNKICYYNLAAKSSGKRPTGHLPQTGVQMCSRNIAMVFYPTGAAYGLTVRCAAAWHGPSRELGPCAKLDGLSCMHQLFPGREPHQLYFVALERGILCENAKNRCPCRTLPANRRTPGHLTVLSLGASGAGWYSRLRLKCSRWRW